MHAKTEELLYMLQWTCEMFVRPTFRNLTDSFEAWAYRSGLHRQLAELERQKFIESHAAGVEIIPRLDRALRLTEAGRTYALGGRDPEAQWKRRWDGRWRLVLFDLPNSQSTLRNRLRTRLRRLGFGWLQNSVWISPDPFGSERSALLGSPVDVESLIVFEARPGAGESDEEIVTGAWDFQRINALYAEHDHVLTGRPTENLDDEKAAKAFRKWAARERESWLAAISEDPLLPESLLPQGYLGKAAWRKRLSVMRSAAELMRAFNPALRKL